MSNSPGGSEAEPEVIWRENDDANGVADLLGFDFGGADSIDRSGLMALINSAFVPHRRMPMLDVLFDRAARLMTTGLRQLADENIEVSLDDVSSTRFGDFLQSLPQASVVGVARAPALEGNCLFAADQALILAIVDVLLGGRRASVGARDEDRGFTAIELGLANRILSALVEAAGAAFEPVIAGGFALDRMETRPRFAAIAPDASVCALAKYRIRLGNEAGRAALLIPYAALEPVRGRLLEAFIGEASRSERAWRGALETEVAGASVELRAVLADEIMTLEALRALAPGDTLVFKRAAGAVAELRAGEAALARARVGRSGERIAVRIEDALAPLAAPEAGS